MAPEKTYEERIADMLERFDRVLALMKTEPGKPAPTLDNVLMAALIFEMQKLTNVMTWMGDKVSR